MRPTIRTAGITARVIAIFLVQASLSLPTYAGDVKP
jgi:hypothetical protein